MKRKVHNLKTDPRQFVESYSGDKTSEVRFDDRGYRVGSLLLLNETIHSGEEMARCPEEYPLEYTGRYMLVRITSVHRDQGMKNLWVVLSYVVLDKLPLAGEEGQPNDS